MGFPAPEESPKETNPVEAVKDKAEEVKDKAEEVKDKAEEVKDKAEEAVKDKVEEAVKDKVEEAAKIPESAAKAATDAVDKVAEEASKLPTSPSVPENLLPGGVPQQLNPQEIQAAVLALQSVLKNPVAAVTPALPTNPTISPNQVLSVLANSQNPNALANILKNIPNPIQFIRSLLMWLGPTSQITQNIIDGLISIHLKNRQPGVELMRTATEPIAMILRGFLAPVGQAEFVDKFRSAVMKGTSDGIDNLVQGSKVIADTFPQGMQQFETTASGLLNMAPLDF